MTTDLGHHDEFVPAFDNLRLFMQRWETADRRGVVGILHGFGEHAGRYEALIERLVEAGYEVWTIDFRGHGQADGRRGHVDRFADYLQDVDTFVSSLRPSVGEAPLFLVGHSLGGLVLARWLLEQREAPLAGAVFASPYLDLGFRPPGWKLALAKLVGTLIPFLPMPNGIQSEQLTRDPEARRAVDRDPLYNRTVTPRWFAETQRAQEIVRTQAGSLTTPALVLVPEADPIAAPQASYDFFDSLGAADKELRRYPEALHELFNELPQVRERAIADLIGWLERRS